MPALQPVFLKYLRILLLWNLTIKAEIDYEHAFLFRFGSYRANLRRITIRSQLGPVFLEQTNSRNYQVNFYEDDISTQQR